MEEIPLKRGRIRTLKDSRFRSRVFLCTDKWMHGANIWPPLERYYSSIFIHWLAFKYRHHFTNGLALNMHMLSIVKPQGFATLAFDDLTTKACGHSLKYITLSFTKIGRRTQVLIQTAVKIISNYAYGMPTMGKTLIWDSPLQIIFWKWMWVRSMF